MDNWGTFQENLTIAYNSEGTLQKQADIYAESWEAARKRVKAATEDLFDSIIDEDFFIFILYGFDDVLNVLADFVDSMNGLPGILTLVASIMTRIFSNQIAESINNIAFGVKSLTGQTKESAEKLVQTASTMAQNINFDTGTQAGDREGQALQDRLVLQEQIKSVAANLTDEQRVQLSQVLEINDAYAQQAIEVAKVREAASQAQQNAAAPIRKKVAESARSENGDVDQAKLATNLKIYQEARKAMLNMATAGAKAAESIKVIGNASKSDAKSIENMKKSVAQLTEHLTNVSRAGAAEKITILLKEFENGARTLEDFQAELAKIVTVEDLLQDTSVEMSYNLEQALKGVAKTTAQEVEELANATMNLAIAEQNSTNANNAYRDSFENIKTSITNFKTALGTFGDNVTKTMQGLSSLASGMQGLLGAFKALKNPDLSFGEKMLQITMSLSMAIPSLIAGLKALNAEQLKKNKQDLIEIANGTAKLIKTGLQATADWAEAKAINGVTIATKLQTAANWALQASMGPVQQVYYYSQQHQQLLLLLFWVLLLLVQNLLKLRMLKQKLRRTQQQQQRIQLALILM